jgi:anaerobic magnesium-protoporphyrin IX monomethyl ester cyclase
MADDIFGLKPGWIERFADRIVERRALVPFKCLLRADGASDAIVSALKRAGCRTAWIGAESGSQRILDAMEKGTRVEQIGAAARRLHAAGIDVGFFLQFGYPGETLEDIELTLRMVRDCRPDDIGVSVSYPLPGTPFYDRVKTQLGEKQNWVDSNDLAMMYRATYAPEFYRALHALVHAQFRARKLSAAHSLRETASAVYHGVRAPWLQLKVRRLARDTSAPPVIIRPVLTPQAAAIPTDQP